jgi:hypothetical protein
MMSSEKKVLCLKGIPTSSQSFIKRREEKKRREDEDHRRREWDKKWEEFHDEKGSQNHIICLLLLLFLHLLLLDLFIIISFSSMKTSSYTQHMKNSTRIIFMCSQNKDERCDEKRRKDGNDLVSSAD